jgi:hypothetical protein
MISTLYLGTISAQTHSAFVARKSRFPLFRIMPQSPLMNPASINNRLNLRASAPSLQA